MRHLLMMMPLQESVEELANESSQKTLSIFDLIMGGGLGGQVIIGLLFVLLLVAIYVYFERLGAIKSAGKMDPNFMNQIRQKVTAGEIDQAKILCSQHQFLHQQYHTIDQFFALSHRHLRCLFQFFPVA